VRAADAAGVTDQARTRDVDGGHDAGRDDRNASAVPAADASAKPWHVRVQERTKGIRGHWARAFSGGAASEPAKEPLEIFPPRQRPCRHRGESVGRQPAPSRPAEIGLGRETLAAGRASSRRRSNGQNGAKRGVERTGSGADAVPDQAANGRNPGPRQRC